ncbi:hypothetical protein SGLAU_24045 [Streptomyces glaucescens]|uniref:Uncharacterized protein n=1 Tax=Streptomyces glaucescens TaxID=1907 RepID=A0A089X9W6_STRGA|nr:hypothetical protein SGLAU_24045 [Streptomyces glaucescens]
MAPTSCFTGQVHRLPDAPEAYGAMITRTKAAPGQSRYADRVGTTKGAMAHSHNQQENPPPHMSSDGFSQFGQLVALIDTQVNSLTLEIHRHAFPHSNAPGKDSTDPLSLLQSPHEVAQIDAEFLTFRAHRMERKGHPALQTPAAGKGGSHYGKSGIDQTYDLPPVGIAASVPVESRNRPNNDTHGLDQLGHLTRGVLERGNPFFGVALSQGGITDKPGAASQRLTGQPRSDFTKLSEQHRDHNHGDDHPKGTHRSTPRIRPRPGMGKREVRSLADSC